MILKQTNLNNLESINKKGITFIVITSYLITYFLNFEYNKIDNKYFFSILFISACL